MRTHPWIVWYAVLLHSLWACLLLVSQKPYGATALHVYSPLPRPLMAGALLTASVLAAWAITRRQPSWRTLAALLPQQAILTASAYAGRRSGRHRPLRRAATRWAHSEDQSP